MKTHKTNQKFELSEIPILKLLSNYNHFSRCKAKHFCYWENEINIFKNSYFIKNIFDFVNLIKNFQSKNQRLNMNAKSPDVNKDPLPSNLEFLMDRDIWYRQCNFLSSLELLNFNLQDRIVIS